MNTTALLLGQAALATCAFAAPPAAWQRPPTDLSDTQLSSSKGQRHAGALAPALATASSSGICNASTPPPAAGTAPYRLMTSSRQAGPCGPTVLIDFEGIADRAPIGTLAFPGLDVTFGPSWLGLIDQDAGGTGNFANEPSPSTVAFFLDPADPIDFSIGINSIEVLYTASADSLPVTLTAWDGPGGTGNVVDTAVGDTVGYTVDGALCSGDSSGDFCLWDSLVLYSTGAQIRSVTVAGALADRFAFDNMVFSASGDTDGDSLLDVWETCGIDVNGDGIVDLDLPALGANPLVPDIFVEIDGMDGYSPTQADLAGVVAVFASHGINLHLEHDELTLPPAIWTSRYGAPEFQMLKSLHYGTAQQRTAPLTVAAKRLAYRYCVFANRFGPEGKSGIAEIGGDDFVVALGHPDWSSVAGDRDTRAGTFMHELGHTLGLMHGGTDMVGFKPNYRSVMNYYWQTPTCMNRSHWKLDYSHTALPTLNEDSLAEPFGVGGLAGQVGEILIIGPPPLRKVPELGAIDFDRNGTLDGFGLTLDLSFSGLAGDSPSPGQTYPGADDWSNLDLNFRDNINYANGVVFHDIGGEMTANDWMELNSICPEPVLFCTADVNSLGCTSTVSVSGVASASGPDNFEIAVDAVLGGTFGALFCSDAEDRISMFGTTTCLGANRRLVDIQISGGNTSQCNGSFRFPVSQAFLVASGYDVGTTVYAQCLARDRAPSPNGVIATQAVLFTVCQ